MAEKLVPISGVLPESPFWRCKVAVLESMNKRAMKGKSGFLKTFTLQDEEGTKVQAMVYGDDIEIIQERLKQRETYIISGATVAAIYGSLVPPSDSYRYLWKLSRRTLIELAPSDSGIAVSEEHDVTPFDGLGIAYSEGKPIDVIGVVIHQLLVKTIKVKLEDEPQRVAEFLLVDRGEQAIPLTLWGVFADIQGAQLSSALTAGEFPVLCGKRIGVKSFKGISLSTRFDSHLEVNGECAAAKDLAIWVTGKEKVLGEVAQRYLSEGCSSVTTPPPTNGIVPVSEAVLFLQNPGQIGHTLWVRGTISLPATAADTYYIGCSKCGRKVSALEGMEFHCLLCGENGARGEKRFKVIGGVSSIDADGEVQALFFHRHILHLARMTGSSMHGDLFSMSELNNKLAEFPVAVELRKQAGLGANKNRSEFIVNTMHAASSTVGSSTVRKRLDFTEDQPATIVDKVVNVPNQRAGKKRKI